MSQQFLVAWVFFFPIAFPPFCLDINGNKTKNRVKKGTKRYKIQINSWELLSSGDGTAHPFESILNQFHSVLQLQYCLFPTFHFYKSLSTPRY